MTAFLLDMYTEFKLDPKVLAFTTTTKLGNMAYQVDDGKGVFDNRKKLCDLLNIKTNQLILTHQSHSSVIKEVTNADFGKSELSFESGIDADGFYTKSHDVTIGIFHADCIPLFFYDSANQIVGIIHCGYRGILKHAAKTMLKTYIDNTNADVKSIKLYIGPCRRTKSFELNETSIEEVTSSLLNKYIKENHFDMVQILIDDLHSLGINDSQIQDSKLDTVNNDTYYSAYEKTPIGRMVSCIKFR